jgi:predicted alpha/beta superfamily hydrolase
MARILSRGPGLPEAIVVGIGYPVDDERPSDASNQQLQELRIHDLTPNWHNKLKPETARFFKMGVTTGGAGRFLKFIHTELIPVIEADYRASSAERILAGHSAGGLFALYALFQQPGLFSGYVTADASLGYRDRALFGMEARYARAHKTLPGRLYMGVGELGEVYPFSDMVSIMIQFAARLESRHYKDFTLTKEIHMNCDHSSVIAPAYQAGLRAVMG